MKNNWILTGTAALIALASGGAGGYFLAKHRLTKEFDAELTKQITEAKKVYGNLSAGASFKTPEEAVAALIPDTSSSATETTAATARRAMRNYASPEKTVYSKDEVKELVNSVTEEKNIFDAPPIQVDLGTAVREPGRPYQITQEDFMQNEHDFSNNTFTYYLGDHILANERDEVIDQVNQIVGQHNLDEIPNLPEGEPLYVRNEKYDSDYEIVVSHGKYSVEVAGLDE